MLYTQIARNQRLCMRRHPIFEKNKAMKVFSYLFISFWAVYLIVLGVSTYGIFTDSPYEVFDWVNGGLMWFLTIDFFLRFVMQDTPAQNVKQYKLMNIPTRFLLNTFLLRMGLQPFNLFWAFYFVPVALLSIPQYYGIAGLISFLFSWWLIFVLNSYWYLLWRTIINRNALLSIIPVISYALILYFGYFFDSEDERLFHSSINFMRGFLEGKPASYLSCLAVAVPLYLLNYRMQQVSIYVEIAKAEMVHKVKSNNMTGLDRFGIIGEYLKLEIKSTMRNLVVRKQFLSGTACMLMLCCLFSFTDVYDGLPFMKAFICIYCYTCLGVMTLTTIMCAEGNYIDGLMVHKEMILSLLKAKYYFQCIMLLVPMLFTVIPIAQGKMTLLTSLSCLFFSSGIVFPFLFQLAVYNDSAIHLNRKLTSSGRDTKMQMLMSGAALFLPMFVMYVLVDMLSETTAAWIMAILGITGFTLHPLWLKNIYHRFMQRRYQNMEGFRNSRE